MPGFLVGSLLLGTLLRVRGLEGLLLLSMRGILNINILINILVDSYTGNYFITSTERYREQYLGWHYLKVYAFNVEGQIKLAAILKVRTWLEGHE